MDKLCSTCDYWTGDRKGGQGNCRRFPPQAAGIVPQQNIAGQTIPAIVSGWVASQSTEWCGEWKTRIEL